jgi:hypothetical protein
VLNGLCAGVTLSLFLRGVGVVGHRPSKDSDWEEQQQQQQQQQTLEDGGDEKKAVPEINERKRD